MSRRPTGPAPTTCTRPLAGTVFRAVGSDVSGTSLIRAAMVLGSQRNRLSDHAIARLASSDRSASRASAGDQKAPVSGPFSMAVLGSNQ